MQQDVKLMGETTELLQLLIRNRCVNDGAVSSGHEARNATTLRDYLDGIGIEPFVMTSEPGRDSVVYRLEGTDPGAPTQLWMAHTDVVPANELRWTVDPFGGELSDGKVWGRGAVDMLNVTSSMAVAFKQLVLSGKRPKGDIVYFAVADEESGGVYGAKYALDNFEELLHTDYVITESGGYRLHGGSGPVLPITIGEKGYANCTIRVHGVSGHASMPYGSDNALVTAAQIVNRIAQYEIAPELTDVWQEFVKGMNLDAELTARLLNPEQFETAIRELPDGWAPRAHACAHITMTPTILHGGTKSNVIPDHVELLVNVRSLPGQTSVDIREHLVQAMGDLADRAEVIVDIASLSTQSKINNEFWDAITKVTSTLVPEATCVPTMTAGGTDAYYFRDRGIPAYGYGLFSHRMTAQEFFKGFHGNDEWVDQESLLLTAKLWLGLAAAL